MESSGDGSHGTILMSLNCVPKATGQLPNDSSEDGGKSASLRGLEGRGRVVASSSLAAVKGQETEHQWRFRGGPHQG